MSTIKSSNTNTTSFTIFDYIKYEYLMAGIAGGSISTLILHPFDLLKIRFAVNDGYSKVNPHYTGYINACKKIVISEGYSGLYRGILPNLLGSASSWGFYFLTYNCVKIKMQDRNKNERLGLFMNMVAAADAGILTLILTNPIWVIKTRLCLQYAEDIHFAKSKKYSNIIDAFKKIYSSEGIKGLYKGFIPGLFGVSHGIIQFMMYEELKEKRNFYKKKPTNTKLETKEYITCAAVSKIIAVVITYPYQVLRVRLQDHHHNYEGILHCIDSIWRFEGWYGYYKGLSISLLKVTPATVITFIVYEQVSCYLLGMDMQNKSIEKLNKYHCKS